MPTPVDTRIPRLLVLHRVQGAWSAVSAQQGLDGLEIEACSRVQDAELSDWVAAADAASVRVVLPGAAVVCRTVALGDQLEARLDDES